MSSGFALGNLKASLNLSCVERFAGPDMLLEVLKGVTAESEAASTKRGNEEI